MKCPLAFIAGLTLAACASTPQKDRPAPTPPSPANDCHCDEDTRGFAFKGHIVALLPEQDELRVSFGDIPGALPAGTREFKTTSEVVAAVQPDCDILAWIEQRNGKWWLFDVRLLIPLPDTP
jgi:hypothetical protein